MWVVEGCLPWAKGSSVATAREKISQVDSRRSILGSGAVCVCVGSDSGCWKHFQPEFLAIILGGTGTAL